MTVSFEMLGNAALMQRPKIAFLSSRRVAPAAVMRCYDWAMGMRGGGSAGRLALPDGGGTPSLPCVVGGFQSALERDVLKSFVYPWHFLTKLCYNVPRIKRN